MLLWYDVPPEHVSEHDEWHTRRHFPEQLSVPGFLRVHRWVSDRVSPRYFVLYEVNSLDALEFQAHDTATSWVPRIAGSSCFPASARVALVRSDGEQRGSHAVIARFRARPGEETRLRKWGARLWFRNSPVRPEY